MPLELLQDRYRPSIPRTLVRGILAAAHAANVPPNIWVAQALKIMLSQVAASAAEDAAPREEAGDFPASAPLSAEEEAAALASPLGVILDDEPRLSEAEVQRRAAAKAATIARARKTSRPF